MNLADAQIHQVDSLLIARLTGEVDLSNARAIEEAILVATPNQATTVVLDLGQLEYLDSAGIQLVYRLAEQLHVRGQGLRLVVPDQSAAAGALTLAGVRSHLDTFPTLDEAGAAAQETH